MNLIPLDSLIVIVFLNSCTVCLLPSYLFVVAILCVPFTFTCFYLCCFIVLHSCFTPDVKHFVILGFEKCYINKVLLTYLMKNGNNIHKGKYITLLYCMSYIDICVSDQTTATYKTMKFAFLCTCFMYSSSIYRFLLINLPQCSKSEVPKFPMKDQK